MGLYDWKSGRGTWSQGQRLQRLETGAQRLQNNVIRPTMGQYRRIPATALDDNQDIALTSPTIKKKGGVSVAGNTSGFAFSATATSITWYWDGTNSSHVIVLHRADGTNFTIPTSGSGLTVSGLTAATDYYFLPFWNPVNVCNIGWVQGTEGSPQIAFVLADTTDTVMAQQYLIQQNNQVNEQLTAGFMLASTSGGSQAPPGPGGGGGGGKCVMAGTEIDTLGGFEYSTDLEGNTEWIHLKTANGRELYCTYTHELYHATKGKTAADKLTEGDIVITDLGESELVYVHWTTRNCSLWRVRMKQGHLYWANGFLSHNKYDNR